MQILSIINHKKNDLSFKSSQEKQNLGELTGVSAFIKQSVTHKSDTNKPQIINSLCQRTYDVFTKNIIDDVQNIQKYSKPSNKAKVLSDLANSYYVAGDIDKAGIILAESINELNMDNKISIVDKFEMIGRQENVKLLKDFFYASNNPKSKFFVMKSLNDTGVKEFLPIAEDICECDEAVVSINDKKTIYEARLLINKHYDLNKLETFFNKEPHLKNAALTVISKWGLKEHAELIAPLLSDTDENVKDNAERIVIKLNTLQHSIPIDEEILPPRPLLTNQSTIEAKLERLNNPAEYKAALKEIKLFKNRSDINTLNNEILKDELCEKAPDLIAIIGQTGTLIKHAEFVYPSESQDKKTLAKSSEAFAKIFLRGELDFAYFSPKTKT